MSKKFHLVYKTAASPFFPACLLVSCYSGGFKRLLGVRLKSFSMLTIIDGDVVSWFFEKNLAKNAKIIFNKLAKSPSLIKKIRAREWEISKRLLREIKTPIKKLFDKRVLTSAGEKKVKGIFDLYQEYGEFADAPGFFFQVYEAENFKKNILRFFQGNYLEKENKFNYLLTSYKLTNYERFIFSLLKIINNKKRSREDIRRLAKKYHWLIHDYLGDTIDEKYIEKKIKELKGKGSHLLKQYEDALSRIAEIRRIKRELPPKILSRVDRLQDILYMYNERKKEVANQVNIFIKNLFLYKYPNMSMRELKLVFQESPDELLRLLVNDKMDFKKLKVKRVYLFKDDTIERGADKYLSLILGGEKTNVLKGSPASPGFVSGRVNMVLNVSHINKFRKGDILVAPFTNVSYLPIMSQAKAILTETGGMTSHAAIISRELKIPSVVGIKNLLNNLSDGDMVEVDANHGIVKVVKK